MIEAILTAVIPVVIIAVICAVMLVVASKFMAVKEDERFPAVRECLPAVARMAEGLVGPHAQACVQQEYALRTIPAASIWGRAPQRCGQQKQIDHA